MTQVPKSLHIKAVGGYRDSMIIVGPADAMDTIASALLKCHILQGGYQEITDWEGLTVSGLRDAECLFEAASVAQMLKNIPITDPDSSVNTVVSELYKTELRKHYERVSKNETI